MQRARIDAKDLRVGKDCRTSLHTFIQNWTLVFMFMGGGHAQGGVPTTKGLFDGISRCLMTEVLLYPEPVAISLVFKK